MAGVLVKFVHEPNTVVCIYLFTQPLASTTLRISVLLSSTISNRRMSWSCKNLYQSSVLKTTLTRAVTYSSYRQQTGFTFKCQAHSVSAAHCSVKHVGKNFCGSQGFASLVDSWFAWFWSELHNPFVSSRFKPFVQCRCYLWQGSSKEAIINRTALLSEQRSYNVRGQVSPGVRHAIDNFAFYILFLWYTKKGGAE